MRANRRRLIADGVITGMIGYGVVASFFVVVNLVTGRSPFHTANLLGAVLFGGADAAAATIEPGLVIAFNGVHLAAFLVIGFFAAWLVYETELHPVVWYVAFFLFLIAGIGTLAVMLAGSGLAGGVLAGTPAVTRHPAGSGVAWYEAARLDGAGPVQEFFAVSLPALRGELAVALTLTIIAALRTFDLVYVMTSGGPGGRTRVPAYEVYDRVFVKSEVGTGMTVAVLLTAVILLVTVAINRLAEGADE